jgi:hypothetical protein
MNYCSAGQKCERALERDLRLSHCFVRRWRLAEQTAVDGWTRTGLAEKSVDDFVVDWPSQSECSAAQKSVKHTERGKKGHAACARFVLCKRRKVYVFTPVEWNEWMQMEDIDSCSTLQPTLFIRKIVWSK